METSLQIVCWIIEYAAAKRQYMLMQGIFKLIFSTNSKSNSK